MCFCPLPEGEFLVDNNFAEKNFAGGIFGKNFENRGEHFAKKILRDPKNLNFAPKMQRKFGELVKKKYQLYDENWLKKNP